MKSRRFSLLAIFLAPVAVVVVGCGGPTIVGSGKVVTVNREIGDCDLVNVYGVGHLKIRKGDKTTLKITADDNLVEYVKSEVQDGVLSVGVKNGSFTWTSPPVMELTVKDLKAIEMEGQTSVTAQDIATPSLKVKVNGQNSVKLTGQAETQDFHVNGQSTIDATKLTGKSAEVHSNGVITIHLAALAEIHGKLNGTGSLDYEGTPKVLDVKTNGLAKVAERK